jgi:hypothetical protein
MKAFVVDKYEKKALCAWPTCQTPSCGTMTSWYEFMQLL